ncbi:MFS transporter [Aeromicrobium duanguangcaii]|uniref:MFS transporter n=1 Tax=Aeromicrobium duanguangcaii TaxID=2968086 RepID=A0ABY5KDH0_9ACTN|nr:MFS transporter [Aeromicrobium duanguangcaii]MCD9155389.1 MFS transporter [Aeromicrobium duanguangcaii]MCL3838357.1 MFS transporter [Aeromicrobium duanguangcaii]UUI68339.1 MFS transporter [Aeromicrobium duanguangcaii]
MSVQEQNHRGAYLVWLVGLAAYLVAVFHRSSLAVAGLVASERFDISAAQLSTFVMLQLLVYAGMQIPVGLAVDRFGPRAVMLAGAVVLTLSQAAFAFSESYATALAARFFVGMGDAMTFVCLLRLVNAWFSPGKVPQITLLTGPIGQLGAIIAAVPMTWALSQLGWTKAYLLAAGFGLVITVAVLAFVRDEPKARSVRGAALSWTNIRTSLGASWEHPGTRLGFWMHFVTQFSSTVLGLLWGYPFFVRGEHTSETFAGTLLTLMVVAVMIAGPVLGRLIGNYPWHRSTIVLTIVSAIVVVWTAVLAWPGDAPGWLLVVMVIVVGVGGPASMIGFDLVRTSNPIDRLSTATGIVNQAGFLASLITVIAVGVILDLTGQNFKAAMSFQYVLWALGLLQVWRYRVKTRARMVRDDPGRWARYTRIG